MNFPVVFFIDIANTSAKNVLRVRVRGNLILEPKERKSFTICGLEGDRKCLGLVLEINKVSEDISRHFVSVWFKDLNPDWILYSFKNPVDFAVQLEDYFVNAGWIICDDNGN
jgi:hypothetical protein